MAIRQATQADLVLHWDLNRERDDAHVYTLMQHMQDFGGFNASYPIEAIDIDGKLHIFSGHHRYEAAFGRDLTCPILPLDTVPVAVTKGDFDTLVERMWNAHDDNSPKKNPTLGLQLSKAEEKAQRLIQLSFSHVYEQSSQQLGDMWNINRKTVDRLRQQFVEQLRHIVSLSLPESELLARYHYTPERLAVMVELVNSGRRVGRDGKTYHTQASETKKEETREELIEECRELITAFKMALSTFYEDNAFTHFRASYIQRRLYRHWELNHAQNVSRYTVPVLKKEIAGHQAIIDFLKLDSADWHTHEWCQEFRQTHECLDICHRLRQTEMRTLGCKPYISHIDFTQTSEWEELPQEERLSRLKAFVASGHRQLEAEARAAAKVSEKEEAATNLEIAKRGAARACSELVKTFKTYKDVLKDADYASFLAAACEHGGYSESTNLIPPDFLKPNDVIEDEQHAHRVRDIADRLRVALISHQPPDWMAPFLVDTQQAEKLASVSARWEKVRTAGIHDEWHSGSLLVVRAGTEDILNASTSTGVWRLVDGESETLSAFFKKEGPRTLDMSEAAVAKAETYLEAKLEAGIRKNVTEAHQKATERVRAALETQIFPQRVPEVELPEGGFATMPQRFFQAARAVYPGLLSDTERFASFTPEHIDISEGLWRKVFTDLGIEAETQSAAWIDSYLEEVVETARMQVEIDARWAALREKGISDTHRNGQWHLKMKGEKGYFHTAYGPANLTMRQSLAGVAEVYVEKRENASAESSAFQAYQAAMETATSALDALFAECHNPGLGDGQRQELQAHIRTMCLPNAWEDSGKRALTAATEIAKDFVEVQLTPQEHCNLRQELMLIDVVLHTYLSSEIFTGVACLKKWRDLRNVISVCANPDKIVSLQVTAETVEERLQLRTRIDTLQSWLDGFQTIQAEELQARAENLSDSVAVIDAMKTAALTASDSLKSAIGDKAHCPASQARTLNETMTRLLPDAGNRLDALRILLRWTADALK